MRAERRREKASGRARRWSGTARCGCSEPAAGAAKAGRVAGGATGSRWGPEVASAWSAQAARSPRPRTATCGRSPGWRQASGHEIWEGHGVARALSAAAVLTRTTKFRMDRRVSTFSRHRSRPGRKAGWWSRAARQRHSDWSGTSAGSIGKRPAPSGSPASAWASCASGGRRPRSRCLRTKITRRQRGGWSLGTLDRQAVPAQAPPLWQAALDAAAMIGTYRRRDEPPRRLGWCQVAKRPRSSAIAQCHSPSRV